MIKNPKSDQYTELCDELLEILREINPRELCYMDPIASLVLDDHSPIIASLTGVAKEQFFVCKYLNISPTKMYRILK